MNVLTPRLGRVLVVDDEPELLSALVEALSARGYETAGAETGAAALAALRARPFELLLTDLMMPGMDGIELLKAGVALDPNLVGVVMTGQGTVPTAVAAMKSGAFDYLLKPFRLDAALLVLARALEVRRLRLENIQLRDTVAIYELTQAIAYTLDLNTILNKTADAALQQCDADEASIMLPTPDGQELVIAVVRGEQRGQLLGTRVPIGAGIAGWVARERGPLTLPGEVHDPRFAPLHPRKEIQSAVSIPMLSGNQLIGVLNVNLVKGRGQFSLGQVKALSILVSTAAAALENARLHAQVMATEERFRALIENSSDGIILLDAHGQPQYASPSITRILGYTVEELLTHGVWPALVHPDDRLTLQKQFGELIRDPGQLMTAQNRFLHHAGDWRWLEVSISNLLDQASVAAMVINYRDITERKLAEATLLLQSTALNSAANGIVITDLKGKIEWVNPAFTAMTGYPATQAIGKNPRELVKSDKQGPAFYKDLWDTILAGNVWHGELINRRKDGSLYTEEQTITPMTNTDGKVTRFIAIKQDITERKQAEAALALSHDLLSRAEQIGHVGSWERNVATNREVWSDGLYRLCGLEPQGSEASWEDWFDRVHPEDQDRVRLTVEAAAQSQLPLEYECRILRPDGVQRFVLTKSEFVFDERGVPARQFGLTLDITERKLAEAAVAVSEAKLRALFAAMTDVVLVLDGQGRYLQIAPTNPLLRVKPPEELLGRTMHEVMPVADADKLQRHIRLVLDKQQPISLEYSLAVDGLPMWFEAVASPFEADKVIWVARDVTERKRRQIELEAVAAVSTALRGATTRAEIMPAVLDEMMSLLEAGATAISLVDPLTGELVVQLGRGDMVELAGRRFPANAGISGHVIATGQLYTTDDTAGDPFFLQLSPRNLSKAVACLPLIASQQVLGVLWAGRNGPFGPEEVSVLTAIADMAGSALQRATLHEQTEQRLQRLAALRTIDVAISSSLDLRVTLNVLLDQVMSQLHADAADVLLLNPNTRTLKYAGGRGMRGQNAERSSLRLGQGYAGRVALEGRPLSLPDLATEAPEASREWLLKHEAVRAYHGVPLIAKGEVQGVLEVFHRAPLVADSDWLDFLQALAGQAAIAIDNTQLFTDLQRSNLDLGLAYQATIEGWSRGLDLRDKETEGHSQRVTEVTLKLARSMGITDEELVHIRRGALLHDIGKLGVPDSILLKPGPLTPDEWVVMRQHPTFAYEMLSPIHYLRLALDIPYCHHEKWDGTGYPRGLKGDEIPLSARLFAVVDVWDALSSDRPYRLAWPEDKVLEHIRSLAGTHFDPQVVRVTLESGVLTGRGPA